MGTQKVSFCNRLTRNMIERHIQIKKNKTNSFISRMSMSKLPACFGGYILDDSQKL